MKSIIAVIILFGLLAASPVLADNNADFDSPSEAVTKLVTAVQNHDNNEIHRIFGPETDDVIYSGDEVQDRSAGQKFLDHYAEGHEIEAGGEKAILFIGREQWPFPVPLVRRGEKWFFDTKGGKEEILNRRIGRNEIAAISTSRALIDAQKDYFNRAVGGGEKKYAGKIISSHGSKDGLFWPREPKDVPSPLGPAVAQALDEGYRQNESGEPVPFHGYFFRLARADVKGFVLVAYPANYGNSGVMTFVADQSGKLVQADLGPKTAEAAVQIKRVELGRKWSEVAETLN